jgi:hypothetical protein
METMINDFLCRRITLGRLYQFHLEYLFTSQIAHETGAEGSCSKSINLEIEYELEGCRLIHMLPLTSHPHFFLAFSSLPNGHRNDSGTHKYCLRSFTEISLN